MIVYSNDALLVMDRAHGRNPNWGYRKILAWVRRAGYPVTEREVRNFLRNMRKRT